MNKSIRTYKDLLEEKSRLQNLLALQKQEIKNNFSELKEELKPVNLVSSHVAKLLTRKRNNPITQGTIRFLGDFILKRKVLARSGWAARTFIPVLFKNYASNILKDREQEILHKIASWLRQRKFKESS